MTEVVNAYLKKQSVQDTLNEIVKDINYIPNYRERAFKNLVNSYRTYLYSLDIADDNPESQKHDSDEHAILLLKLL